MPSAAPLCSVPRDAVLLVNLGTPEAPTPGAVRSYLAEFLSDPRVVEIPRLLWWPILHGIILNTRPRKSAQKYRSIWTADGSPLKAHTQRQAGLLAEALGPSTPVAWAMRYGSPSIPDAMERLRAGGCRRILVLPLYPQYADSTGASVADVALPFSARTATPVRVVRDFHDDPGYIAALAGLVRDYWSAQGRPDRLIMSFHGLPRYTLERGDPYHDQCHATAGLLAQALQLQPGQWQLAFQSRFGRARWLEPYTAVVLEELGRQRLRRVDVVCPGFVSDCLETLEEIALEGRDTFQSAGGGDFHAIPCLNERPDWLAALAALAQARLAAWPDSQETGATF